MKRLCLALAVLFLTILPALAVNPDERLTDPALEARARAVSKDLRCVVCQNQSIDDSNADLARDMRILVRDRIQAGDSNEEVKAYLVSRYGDFVLLKPPVQSNTVILWFGPAVIVACGLAAAFAFYRRGRLAPEVKAAALAPEEEARLAALLDDEGSRP